MEVSVFADGNHAMTKDAEGIWSVTLGPLGPEIYEYYFRVDGAKVLDVENKDLKMGSFSANLVDVPVNLRASIKYKTFRMELCRFVSIGPRPYSKQRTMYVYLPPQYDSEPLRRFPVLYLRHGNGDDETAWTLEGRASVILENLIAEGKAVPMIIVMSYGEINSTGGGSRVGIAALGKELMDDIIP
jgi:enterochelin esterase family protein